MSILERRCRVRGRFGLKAAFTTFEPKTLPDAVFQAEPERGWRFSQYRTFSCLWVS